MWRRGGHFRSTVGMRACKVSRFSGKGSQIAEVISREKLSYRRLIASVKACTWLGFAMAGADGSRTRGCESNSDVVYDDHNPTYSTIVGTRTIQTFIAERLGLQGIINHSTFACSSP